MVSDKGGKFGFVYKARQRVYLALRRKGYSQEKAARIANAGRTKAARKAMARKAARSRRR
jgi:transcriptional regulator